MVIRIFLFLPIVWWSLFFYFLFFISPFPLSFGKQEIFWYRRTPEYPRNFDTQYTQGRNLTKVAIKFIPSKQNSFILFAKSILLSFFIFYYCILITIFIVYVYSKISSNKNLLQNIWNLNSDRRYLFTNSISLLEIERNQGNFEMTWWIVLLYETNVFFFID